MRSRLRREDGQALVELAFTLPLLLFVLFAIIDFGLALNQENSTTDIANIAVRQASVSGTTSTQMCGTTSETTLSAWTICEAQATGTVTPSNVCIIDTTASGSYALQDAVKVEVSSVFNWLGVVTGGVGSQHGVGGLPSTITQSATMRLELGSSGNTFLTGTPQCSS